MMLVASVFCFSIVVVCASAAAIQIPKLPGNHVACFRNDPEFDRCFRGSLQNLFRAFSRDGAPELGMKPFDPLHVPQMLVEYQQERISGKMLIKDSMSTGFNKIRVNGIRSNFADPAKFEMEIDVEFPTFFVKGSYESEGNILFFPINGGGVYNISMKDISGTWKLSGTPFEKDGQTYVELDHFKFRPKVGSMKIYASNLYTGNDALNAAALSFVNQYWPAMYEELLPFAEQGWDRVMTGIANKLFTNVPFDEIFPVL